MASKKSDKNKRGTNYNCVWREIAIALMCVILGAIISLLIVIAAQHK